jgi:chemotaxis protein MotA
VMEGGSVADVSQITAALIVFGGTLGAVMLTIPWSNLKSAIRRMRLAFLEPDTAGRNASEDIIAYAVKARQHGVVSLEPEASAIEDPFLQRALMLAVDGVDPKSIRDLMEIEIKTEVEDAEADAGVFEAAGGYAPTIGILGAVIGLIQVMKHLDNISQVGSGIAVAFVATVYGVGSANLLFLPIGQKIRLRAQQAIRLRQLMLEGVICVSQGMNPTLIRQKLAAFGRQSPRAAADAIALPAVQPEGASA